MKITVIGTGYVGLVNGTCPAKVGNDVPSAWISPPKKSASASRATSQLTNRGLLEMVKRNFAAGRLHFTTHFDRAVEHGTIELIAVPLPPNEDGSTDLQYVLAATRNLGDQWSCTSDRTGPPK